MEQIRKIVIKIFCCLNQNIGFIYQRVTAGEGCVLTMYLIVGSHGISRILCIKDSIRYIYGLCIMLISCDERLYTLVGPTAVYRYWF